ncbi:hypothetical protein T492DRAFT_268156 [Pavlovales sp. CCMP2436]|nr:hypothetical protein T492DRAFT_268156 [Pavlovales sp. CCMP2436]
MYSRDDRVTEVTHQSFLGKMGGACCGLLVGLMLYAGAGALIWWNEGRAVFTDRAIHAGLASVVESPSCDVLDATLEGRLVHVSCPLGRLDNYSFIGGALRVETAAFVRVDAEMYQWEEMTRSETTKDSVGGGSTTRKTYSYSTGWLGRCVNAVRIITGLSGGGMRGPARASEYEYVFPCAAAVNSVWMSIGQVCQRVPPLGGGGFVLPSNEEE